MTRLLATLLAAGLSWGCFVLDEMDDSMALMDKHSERSQKRKKKTAAAREEAAKGKDRPTMLERLQALWDGKDESQQADEESDSVPPHPDDVLVRCGLGGRVQFTRKFDCQIRGGRVEELPDS